MSNFVHKVKDAIADRDKPVTRNQAADDRHRSAGNPFTPNYNTNQNAHTMSNSANMDSNANRPEFTDYNSGSAPNMKTQGTCSMPSGFRLYYYHMLKQYPDKEYDNYPTSTTTESQVGQPSSNARNSTSTTGDTTSSASSADMNTGPHNSNLLNKLDPRVDSDLGMLKLPRSATAHRNTSSILRYYMILLPFFLKCPHSKHYVSFRQPP